MPVPRTAGTRSLLARFVALFLQGFASLALWDEKYFNLAAALRFERFEDDLALKEAYFFTEYNFSWLLGTSITCNLIEVLTMALGHPSTSSRFNLLAMVLHIIGCVLTLYLLVQPWPIQLYNAVFLLCSALPMIISMVFAMDRFVLKSSVLRRIDVRI